ncbi:hypothetical protein VNO77_24850 [Canavalia gladiata]|uniref:Uncharacterized protein n=1 Tax=Canavalia gladiata TaxID=3824 RepID=A0AAN9L9K1_CANGL
MYEVMCCEKNKKLNAIPVIDELKTKREKGNIFGNLNNTSFVKERKKASEAATSVLFFKLNPSPKQASPINRQRRVALQLILA